MVKNEFKVINMGIKFNVVFLFMGRNVFRFDFVKYF